MTQTNTSTQHRPRYSVLLLVGMILINSLAALSSGEWGWGLFGLLCFAGAMFAMTARNSIDSE